MYRTGLRSHACKRVTALCASLLVTALVVTSGAAAQLPRGLSLAAQAQPDECFNGIGNPYPPLVNGRCAQGIPKVNDTYLWGFTTSTDNKYLWFGTTTNAACANLASVNGLLKSYGRGPWPPFATDQLTCEYDHSQAAQKDPTIGQLGDSRPGRYYQYDVQTGHLIDRTPPGVADFLDQTGARSAGEDNGVVLFATNRNTGAITANSIGPSLLFAFDSRTGQYLGHMDMPQYDNFKVMWVAKDHNLYLGADLSTPENTQSSSGTRTGGEVLKWTGDRAHPFQFQIVARLGDQPAYMQDYQGRLIAGTWNSGTPIIEAPGLYISPPLGKNGLTPGDATKWRRFFGTEQFHPDRISATALDISRMENIGPWLYVTTLGLPGISTIRHIVGFKAKFPNTLTSLYQWYSRAEPLGTVFRFRDIGTGHMRIQLVYGSSCYFALQANGNWRLERNLMHLTPLFGGQGFKRIGGCNPFGTSGNVYAGWGGATFRGKTYFGTFDDSGFARYIFFDPATHIVDTLLGHHVPNAALNAIGRLVDPLPAQGSADIWMFDNDHSPARPLTTTAFGNADLNGFRDFFPIGNKEMFIGAQSVFNFPVGGARFPARVPGWQLYKYVPPGG